MPMESRQETTVELPQRLRHSDEGELDITPMIDITFLLLAFFVVVSKMDPTTVVNMPKARYGETVPEQSAVVVIVEATDRELPVVYKGTAKTEVNRCTAGSIEDLEDELEAYVRDTMQGDSKKTTVIIKAERKVIYRHLDIVKRSVSRGFSDDRSEEQTIHIGIEEE